MAGISLVGPDRQRFVSMHGFDLWGVPWKDSLCVETVRGEGVRVIHEPAEEVLYRDNPFVSATPPIRFYAGCPLRSGDDTWAGTLFVMDRRHRKVSAADLDGLEELASLAESELRAIRSEDLARWSRLSSAPGGSARFDGVFRQIFLRAGVGMILSDTSGAIIQVNPAAANSLGYGERAIVGQHVESFTHPDDVAENRQLLRRLHEREMDRYQVEKRYLRENGDVMWGRLTVTRLEGGEDRGRVLGILQDITEQVWARNELLRYHDELERSKETAEAANQNKSEFLAKMSHELRTPHNSVIGFARVLQKKGGDVDPKLMSFVDRILANGLHLLGLINDILDLSKVEAGKLELEESATPVNELVTETLKELEASADAAGLLLRAELDAAGEPLLTDRARLKQILINLVANALKFTDEGEVTVRVVANPDGGPPLALEVEDTGSGIPSDRLDDIFDAFQQGDNSTARRFEGTGLGLTISRSLAQLMGFQLTVRSEEGVGSVFRLSLAGKRSERPVHAA